MGHTPGPWFVRESDGDHHTEVYAETTGAVCYPEPDDAHLIAAAPELLAVCQAIASDLSLFQFTDGWYRLSEQSAGVILQSLRQVIAKAEGRSE